MTSMSENNTVYYKGSYWNDYAPVREYINKSVSGRGDMDWSRHFASLTKKSFQKALILNCGNGWVERDLYKQGLFQSAIGVDSSPELLHEAQSAARAHGLPLDYVQLDTNRAPRKITFGLPRLASEVGDSKGFDSGRRGECGIFRGAQYGLVS